MEILNVFGSGVIKIVGHERITAFKNNEKANGKHPDFKGDGVVVWVKEGREA